MDGASSERPPAGLWPGIRPTDSFRGGYLSSQETQARNIASTRTMSTQTETHDSQPAETGNTTSTSTHDYVGGPAHSESRNFPLMEATYSSSEITEISSSDVTGDNVKDSAPQSHSLLTTSSDSSESNLFDKNGHYAPIKTKKNESVRPRLASQESRQKTEQEIFQVISQKRRSLQGSVMSAAEEEEEQEQIRRLMSRIFGATRQQNSEDEKTRHVGVVFKNVTVKGMGLGAALQPTLGDPFAAPFRLIKGLLTNPRQAGGKPPVRTLLNNFSGCIRPGEMLLVLGRPGYDINCLRLS